MNKVDKSVETEGRFVVGRGCGEEGTRNYSLIGVGDGNVPELERSGVCTTLWMC